MGSESGNENEKPVHAVSFSNNFWMDTTEVTQSDFDELMSITYEDYSSPAWGNPFGVGADYPAYFVDWGDAALYCNARSKRVFFSKIKAFKLLRGTSVELKNSNFLSHDIKVQKTIITQAVHLRLSFINFNL